MPDDFETLAEALEFVAPSGVILLKKRDKPYELGQSRRLTDADRRGALATVPVTVRGETRRASDANRQHACRLRIQRAEMPDAPGAEDTPHVDHHVARGHGGRL